MADVPGRPVQVLGAGVTSVVLCAAIWSINPWSGGLVLAALVPTVVAFTAIARMESEKWPKVAEKDRVAGYATEQLIQQRPATELAALGSGVKVARLVAERRAGATRIQDGMIGDGHDGGARGCRRDRPAVRRRTGRPGARRGDRGSGCRRRCRNHLRTDRHPAVRLRVRHDRHDPRRRPGSIAGSSGALPSGSRSSSYRGSILLPWTTLPSAIRACRSQPCGMSVSRHGVVSSSPWSA